MKWQNTILMASVSLLFIGGASAQNASRQCANAVAERYNVKRNDVKVSGGQNRGGDSVYTWQAGRSRSGYCVADRNGRVSEVGLGNYNYQRNSAGRNNNRGNDGWGNNNRNNNNRGRDNRNSGWNSGNSNISAPQVNVDTSGRGNYSDGGTSVRITRGWVNTRGNTTVSLSGENNFRVDFYGNITSQNGDREFTMRITGSSRGNASGNLTFRLNKDRNEVEMINVNGRANGRNLTGSFSR